MSKPCLNTNNSTSRPILATTPWRLILAQAWKIKWISIPSVLFFASGAIAYTLTPYYLGRLVKAMEASGGTPSWDQILTPLMVFCFAGVLLRGVSYRIGWIYFNGAVVDKL